MATHKKKKARKGHHKKKGHKAHPAHTVHAAVAAAERKLEAVTRQCKADVDKARAQALKSAKKTHKKKASKKRSKKGAHHKRGHKAAHHHKKTHKKAAHRHHKKAKHVGHMGPAPGFRVGRSAGPGFARPITAAEILGRPKRRAKKASLKRWVCEAPVRTGCGGGARGGHVLGDFSKNRAVRIR